MEFSPASSRELSAERKKELLVITEQLLEETIRRFTLSKARGDKQEIDKENFGLIFEEKDVALLYFDIIRDIKNLALSPPEAKEVKITNDMIRTKLFALGFHLKQKEAPDNLSQVTPTPFPKITKNMPSFRHEVEPPTKPPPSNNIGKGAAIMTKQKKISQCKHRKKY